MVPYNSFFAAVPLIRDARKEGEKVKKVIKTLVVEDDDIARELMETILISCGLEVVGAALDGENAVHWLRRVPQVDLVITDLRMPRMNGFKLIERIGRGSGIKIIVVSGGFGDYSLDELEGVVLAAGADRFLAKPIQILKLREAIDSLFPD